MTGLLPMPREPGAVLAEVKATPSGRACGPALTPAAGDAESQRTGASRKIEIHTF
jgi:hypothetical protein